MEENPLRDARRILQESRRLIFESLGLPSFQRPLIQALEAVRRLQPREVRGGKPTHAEETPQEEPAPGAQGQIQVPPKIPFTPFPIRTALGKLLESAAKAVEAKAEAERLAREAEKIRAEEAAKRLHSVLLRK